MAHTSMTSRKCFTSGVDECVSSLGIVSVDDDAADRATGNVEKSRRNGRIFRI